MIRIHLRFETDDAERGRAWTAAAANPKLAKTNSISAERREDLTFPKPGAQIAFAILLEDAAVRIAAESPGIEKPATPPT